MMSRLEIVRDNPILTKFLRTRLRRAIDALADRGGGALLRDRLGGAGLGPLGQRSSADVPDGVAGDPAAVHRGLASRRGRRRRARERHHRLSSHLAPVAVADGGRVLPGGAHSRVRPLRGDVAVRAAASHRQRHAGRDRLARADDSADHLGVGAACVRHADRSTRASRRGRPGAPGRGSWSWRCSSASRSVMCSGRPCRR